MQLNHIFGLPNPICTLRLASSERPWKILPIVTMATVVQAYTLVSILAPNSLEVGTASVQSELISIPTIFFDSDPPEHSWGYVPADSCDYALFQVGSALLGSHCSPMSSSDGKHRFVVGQAVITPSNIPRQRYVASIWDQMNYLTTTSLPIPLHQHQVILWSCYGPPLPSTMLPTVSTFVPLTSLWYGEHIMLAMNQP